MSDQLVKFFDGHNDTVLSLKETGRSFFEQSAEGHVDLPRAKSGGMAGGFFAAWVPDPKVHVDPDDPTNSTSAYNSVDTMPPMMATDYAQSYALSTLAALFRIEAQSEGKVKIVRTAAELRDAIANDVFAMELHIEGAEPIDEGLDSLEVFYQAGLRSLGIVWSRTNIFGSGVPFAYPSSPDTGPGLTEAGKSLVRACNRLGIMLDLSHLNEKGFWDVANRSEDPLVATHSGVHAICPSSRNLLDTQLDAIRDSEGIVGVNFHSRLPASGGEARRRIDLVHRDRRPPGVHGQPNGDRPRRTRLRLRRRRDAGRPQGCRRPPKDRRGTSRPRLRRCRPPQDRLRELAPRLHEDLG